MSHRSRVGYGGGVEYDGRWDIMEMVYRGGGVSWGLEIMEV